MAGTRTTSASDQVSEAEAALDRLHMHLVAEGISPTLIRRVADGPGPSAETAPQLVIYGEAGWRVATISVGPRSGMYLVDTARVGPDNERMRDLRALVPPAMPHRAVRLVAQACGVGTA
jgi:hypothetical protein